MWFLALARPTCSLYHETRDNYVFVLNIFVKYQNRYCTLMIMTVKNPRALD